MSLRLRLIVVFFLLSVVPVGAVTYYTYSNNAQAIRDAARFEAEVLAGELSQRMTTVTTQISQRVESLMDLQTAAAEAPAPPPSAAADSAASATAAAQAAAQQASVASEQAQVEQAAAERALGAYAAWLKNITIDYGRRGGGGRRGGPPPNGAFPGGRGPGAPPGTPGGPQAPDGPPAGPDGSGRGGLQGANGDEAGEGRGNGRGNNNQGRGGGDGGRGNNNQGRGGPGPGAQDELDPSRIRIDLGQMRREMFEELVPDREAFGEMTPDEQQAIFVKIEERMRGVQQGIDVLRKELETRAVAITEIRTQGETQTAAGTGAAASAPATPGAPARVATPPPSTPAPPPAAPTRPPATITPAPTATPASQGTATAGATAPAVTPASTSGMQRSTELSGRRLAVRVERDGEILGEVGADVDLNLLLDGVFDTTSRNRGEVPFAVGQDGEVFTQTDTDRDQLDALHTTAVRSDADPGTTIVDDWIVATTAGPGGSGLKFGVARPVGDALRELQQTSARNAALGLGFIGLALIAIVPLSGRLTRNLDRLVEGVNRIAQGDYGARVQVRSNDEIGRLARAFNVMAADVEAHHRNALGQERIRRELELGRQIQSDMLPSVPLRLGLTEVKGVSVPAREVGGDFFNYFQLQDGTIALLVGDVSGKGVGAALLMANIQAALRTRLSLGQDLASLAQELDVDIDRTTPGPVYATLFVGILDPVQRQLRCVNAGHNPQYVLRADGRLERMESTGRPIGLFSGGGYTEQHIALDAGDVLFFYTDGCVEAENAAGDMFGADRLEAALAASAGRGADDVIVAVEADVSRFRAGTELQDDATMMVVRVG